jgi:hypothetical protein
MVRKPSKLRSLFSRNHGGGGINIDAADIP